MGLSEKELQERRGDEHVKLLMKNITNKDTGKPYVFISYKSDDWKVVLHEIVYELVTEYGLNVYFDGDFNGHNKLWTDQFRENMEAENCLGVLAFVNDAYATSYATLMELLYSQVGCQDQNYNTVPKPVVTINLSKLSQIKDTDNTGLGVGNDNIHAEAEKRLFDELFQEAAERKILKKTVSPFNRTPLLHKKLCAAMTREVLAYIKANDNLYGSGSTIDDIVRTMKNEFGKEVFGNKSDITSVSKNTSKKQDVKPSVTLGELSDKKTENPVTTVNTVDDIPSVTINESMTLKQFEEMCENVNFSDSLRGVRKKSNVAFFDYLMASLLRGCDKPVSNSRGDVLRKAQYNYCKRAVSREANQSDPKIGASQFTWTTNCRRALKVEKLPQRFFREDGSLKNGRLEDNNDIFEALDENMTIGDVLNKYKNEETGFDTRDNQSIFQAWNLIKNMRGGSEMENHG